MISSVNYPQASQKNTFNFTSVDELFSHVPGTKFIFNLRHCNPPFPLCIWNPIYCQSLSKTLHSLFPLPPLHRYISRNYLSVDFTSELSLSPGIPQAPYLPLSPLDSTPPFLEPWPLSLSVPVLEKGDKDAPLSFGNSQIQSLLLEEVWHEALILVNYLEKTLISRK